MSNEPKGRKVLVVDDEPDVCEMVADVLSDFQVDEAASFEEAVSRLSSSRYDVVILDIMGVRGHDLLDRFGREVPCIMFTAHALTRSEFKKSVKGHARLFLPKEEIGHLEDHVNRVLGTQEPLWEWLVRTVDFKRWFGLDWLDDAFLKELGLWDDKKEGEK